MLIFDLEEEEEKIYINKNLRQMTNKNATNSAAHKIYHVYMRYTRMLDFKFNITYVKNKRRRKSDKTREKVLIEFTV